MAWYKLRLSTGQGHTYSVQLVERNSKEEVKKKADELTEDTVYDSLSISDKLENINSKKDAKRILEKDKDINIAYANDGTTITSETQL
jgi:hypothetical protein